MFYVKPLYICVPLLMMVSSCQWISEHPQAVKQIEEGIQDMIQETEKDIIPLIPIIEAAI